MTGSKHFKGPTDPAADPVMADVLKLGKPGERKDGPSTFVGRVGMQAGLGFAAENERMKAERANGMVLLRLDPKTIGATKFANRHERGLNTKDAAFKQLKESIQANGQDTPIRVRPSVAGDKDYEIVEGHRRHAAILELDRDTEGGFPILARLDAKAAESKDLVLKMYRENAERADLSPYETGTMFAQWLAAGIFPSQRAIGESIGQSEQNVGKYFTVATLPEYAVRAFRDPRVIALRWGTDLAKACRERGDDLKRLAAELAKQTPAPEPDAVFAELTGKPVAARATGRTERASESIKEGNKTLFELSAREGRYGIRLGKHIDKKLRKPLQRELKEWLHAWLKKHQGGSR